MVIFFIVDKNKGFKAHFITAPFFPRKDELVLDEDKYWRVVDVAYKTDNNTAAILVEKDGTESSDKLWTDHVWSKN